MEGEKYNAAAMQAEFQALIDAGAQRILVADVYFGGGTGRSLLNQVFIPLAQRNPQVRFETYWLRETFGFERPSATGPRASRMEMSVNRSNRSAFESVQDRISMTRHEEVSLVLGEDMNVVFNPDAREPIRIFDAEGRVTEIFRPQPGQSTGQLMVELMNGNMPQSAIPQTSQPASSHIPGALPQLPADDDH